MKKRFLSHVKRTLSVMLVLSLITAPGIFPAGISAAGAPNYGDVDGDGYITSADVTMLRRYIAASDKDAFIGENPSFNEANADVDGRDGINIADVTLLRQYIAAGEGNKPHLGPALQIEAMLCLDDPGPAWAVEDPELGAMLLEEILGTVVPDVKLPPANATLDDNFADDAVVVIFTTEVSRHNRDFTASDFEEIDIAEIYDLSRLSDREYSFVKPEWEAMDNMMALARMDMEYRNGRISNATYEAYLHYMTLRYPAERKHLVNVPQFRRMLRIRLAEPGKENVLLAVSLLEQREDIRYVGPDFIGFMLDKNLWPERNAE